MGSWHRDNVIFLVANSCRRPSGSETIGRFSPGKATTRTVNNPSPAKADPIQEAQKTSRQLGRSGILFGADYNPEQWPEEVWPDDVRRMQDAGVNLATIGVFSWSRIQPAEGIFDFDWLDRLIDLLHAGGIGVDLATATATPPHWLSRGYPQSLPVTREGVTLGPGSRQAYAPTSPEYRRLAGELVSRLAERYASHPAVQLWHVNNEYGCHVAADYSDNAASAFRSWLRERYGDVDALNDAWGTTFWSQIYQDFDQVVPPRAAPYSVNPSGWLDFKRFTSDSFRELFRMEKQLIRAAGAQQPITTNFMGAFEAIDYWSWAQDVDVVSDDSYPDPSDPESFREAAFSRDLMRSLGDGRPWLLMEQATNAVNWRPVNAPKAPGQMAALSRQAVARGARGILFFQWRQSRSGAEKFHSAMLPHGGTSTRTWGEVTELGATLAQLPEPMAGEPAAEVALVMDWESRWAIENPDHPATIDYYAGVLDWYRVLHRHNVPVDIVHPTADLSAYRLVVAPQLYLLTERSAQNLSDFVTRGGTLLSTAFSDVVDEHDRFRDGGYAMQLAPLIGATVSEHEGIAGVLEVELEGTRFAVSGVADVLEVTDAEVLGSFVGDWREGRPAILRRRSGEGTTIHLGAMPGADGIEAVLDIALRDAGVEQPFRHLPDAVEVVPGAHGVLVINQGAVPVELPDGDHLAAWEVREIATR
jgi:beta-galactosidase